MFASLPFDGNSSVIRNGSDVPAIEMIKPPTILVVIDDKDIRSAMKYLLKVNDYPTVEASDTEEAAAIAPSRQFDLILLDLDMPLHEGLAAARLIRERAARRDLPVVVIDTTTAKGARADLSTAPDEYVVRLLDLDQLGNLLAYILRAHPGVAAATS